MLVTNNITWKQNKQSIIDVLFIYFKNHHSHSVVVSWRISKLVDKWKAYQRAEWKSQAKSWCVAIPLRIVNYNSAAVLNTTYSKLDLYSSQIQARQALLCYTNHSEIPTRFHNYYPIVLTEFLLRYTYSKSALWEFHFERTFIGSTSDIQFLFYLLINEYCLQRCILIYFPSLALNDLKNKEFLQFKLRTFFFSSSDFKVT